MKVIFHMDLDSYFVSAARTVDQSLIGKPVVISGGGNRSIVTAASYEAKKLGVKVAMPLYRAKILVPHLTVIKPDFGLYTYLSTRVFEFLAARFTNKIEVGSIDECYIDVTDLWEKYCSPYALAKTMQKALLDELRLPSSFGVSSNKFVAKMSTSINKPLGVTITDARNFLQVFGSWPIITYYGIGAPTAAKLARINIHTIGDLAKAKVDDLQPLLGKVSAALINQANGGGSDEINLEHNELKGIGNEVTFQDFDKIERADILKILGSLVELVAQRMKNRNMLGGVIAVYMKVSGGKEITRVGKQKTLSRPIHRYEDILKEAISLFDSLWHEGSLKFIGIRMGKLTNKYEATYQADLFENPANKTPAQTVIDNLNKKFKTKVALTGRELKDEQFKKQHQSRYIESDRILKHYDIKDQKRKPGQNSSSS